jgi:hypothetical protein
MEPAPEDASAAMNNTQIPAQTDLLSRMKRSWRIPERPFTSNVPLIGPLIVFFRRQLNRIAIRWYVPMLLEHQYRFNKQILELAEIQARQADLITDRGLSIATLAEELARLKVRVMDLEEQVQTLSHRATDESAASHTARKGYPGDDTR